MVPAPKTKLRKLFAVIRPDIFEREWETGNRMLR